MADREESLQPSTEEAVAHERWAIVGWHRRRAHEHKAQAVRMCQPYHDGDRSRESERRFEQGVKRNSLATMHYAAAQAIEEGEHHA